MRGIIFRNEFEGTLVRDEKDLINGIFIDGVRDDLWNVRDDIQV